MIAGRNRLRTGTGWRSAKNERRCEKDSIVRRWKQQWSDWLTVSGTGSCSDGLDDDEGNGKAKGKGELEREREGQNRRPMGRLAVVDSALVLLLVHLLGAQSSCQLSGKLSCLDGESEGANQRAIYTRREARQQEAACLARALMLSLYAGRLNAAFSRTTSGGARGGRAWVARARPGRKYECCVTVLLALLDNQGTSGSPSGALVVAMCRVGCRQAG